LLKKKKNKNFISKEIDFFNQNGFVKIKNNFHDEIKKIKSLLKIKKPRNKYVKDYIINIETKNKIVNILADKLNIFFQDLKEYYNFNIIIVDVHAWKNYHFKQTKVQTNNLDFMAESFHQDGYLSTYLKIHINMEDVNKNMGPLKIVKKNFNKKFIKEYHYNNRFNYKNNDLETDYIYSNEGKNGDALLFDSTNCFHRASIPAENQTRKMLQLTLLVLPESLRCKRNYYHDSNQFMNYHNRYRKMCKPQTRYQTLKLLFNYFGFVKNY